VIPAFAGAGQPGASLVRTEEMASLGVEQRSMPASVGGWRKNLAAAACLHLEQIMNNSPTPFGLPDDAPELARRFAMIMAGLGALVARRFLKIPHLVVFTRLLWSRLNRAVRRFHRALTGPAGVAASRIRVDRARPAQIRLPMRRGWIVRELGWEAAAYLAQLEALLAEIETQAALARAPGAGRVLRPICRMLGVAAPLAPRIVADTASPDEVSMASAPVGVRPMITRGTQREGPAAEWGAKFSPA